MDIPKLKALLDESCSRLERTLLELKNIDMMRKKALNDAWFIEVTTSDVISNNEDIIKLDKDLGNKRDKFNDTVGELLKY